MNKAISTPNFFSKISQLFKLGNTSFQEEIPEKKEVTVGLALSSGGARGLAHIGVLQVLEEHNIKISSLCGTSMGAYVGAHHAAGLTSEKTLAAGEHMKDRANLWKIADPIIPPLSGFLKGEKAVEYFKTCIGDPTFEELKIPFYVVTFDLDTQEKLVIRNGNVASAVHASCAIPGIVAPVMWNGHRCSDGAVVDPVPVSVLKEHENPDLVIAVSLLPSLSDIKEGHASSQDNEDPIAFHSKVMSIFNQKTNLFAKGNTVDTLRRCIRAAQAQIAQMSCDQADFVVKPNVYNLSWHSFETFEATVEAGRQAMLAQIPAIKNRIAEIENTGVSNSNKLTREQ